MTNLKLTNKYREDGGAWINATAATVAYATSLLAEYRSDEPDADWHLETRGTVADWHRMDPSPAAAPRHTCHRPGANSAACPACKGAKS